MGKRLNDILAGTALVLALGGLLGISRINSGSWRDVYRNVMISIDANTTPLFYYNNFYKR